MYVSYFSGVPVGSSAPYWYSLCACIPFGLDMSGSSFIMFYIVFTRLEQHKKDERDDWCVVLWCGLCPEPTCGRGYGPHPVSERRSFAACPPWCAGEMQTTSTDEAPSDIGWPTGP